MKSSFTLAIIAGEESGDLLGADLVSALKEAIPNIELNLVGVGGQHLQAQGLMTFFDSSEISLMGLDEIFFKLPKLLYYISNLTTYLLRHQIDCLLIIDSPEFTHRVAKKVKKLRPNLPIIQYVAPSVWAWREQRAVQMQKFIEHLLVILPFEPACLQELNGPTATYVGHRLLHAPIIKQIATKRQDRSSKAVTEPNLLFLPGSRRAEIRKLMPILGEVAAIISDRLMNLSMNIATLPHLEHEVRVLAKNWSAAPTIVVGNEAKWQAMAQADIALAASGTVLLELALCRVPVISIYKMDLFSRIFIKPRIKIWSAALPNIIVDKPLVPEFYNEYLKPDMLAHQVEYYLQNNHIRQAQLNGFEEMHNIMQTTEPAGKLAAKTLLEICGF